MSRVNLYTDGACLGNPGPGGTGVIIKNGNRTVEISEGYKLTTNNRMELMAALTGLQNIPDGSQVDLFTDSRYLSDAKNQEWLEKWQSNGWKTANRKPVENKDLWTRLLDQFDKKDVNIIWIRGHRGHPENEMCDSMAQHAANKPTQIDREFETRTRQTNLEGF